MPRAVTTDQLAREHRDYASTGGASDSNRGHRFRPAFLDEDTGIVYVSRDRAGKPTPYHCLDGLPQALVEAHDPHGRVIAVKATVLAGFERDGVFFTRDEAAALVSQENP